MRRVVLVLVCALLEACSSQCQQEKCGSGKAYQTCVEGNDIVLRDANGAEVHRCKTDHGPTGSLVGPDKNDCSFKHLLAEDAFCAGTGGFGGGTGSTGGGTGSTGGGTGSTGGGTGSTGGGTGNTGRAYCFKRTDNSVCECRNTDDPADFPAPEWARVSACATSAGLVEPSCCIYSDSGGKVTSCSCTSRPKACREDGSSCSCPLANATGDLSQVRTSCQPTGGRICCISDSYCRCGDEQYSGAGCIGFGGFNETATPVSSCTAPARPIDWCGSAPEATSCNGLIWAP